MKLKGAKINFLGDSITEGHGASSVENCFVSLVGRNYGLAEARNYGIGGTRFARQEKPSANERWDLDFCKRVYEMDPDADAVVIFGGINDFGHGDRPIGSPEDRSAETFYGACHELFSTAISLYPGRPIVVLTPLHRLNEDNPRGDGNKAEATLPLSGYRDIIKTVAEYYSLPVLDLWAVSGLQPKVDVIREKFMPDGLHPSDAGYAILAERIGNFLLSL
jgi:lysophospholipase L1-like esterase